MQDVADKVPPDRLFANVIFLLNDARAYFTENIPVVAKFVDWDGKGRFLYFVLFSISSLFANLQPVLPILR